VSEPCAAPVRRSTDACSLPAAHSGHHRSVESVRGRKAQMAVYHREWERCRAQPRKGNTSQARPRPLSRNNTRPLSSTAMSPEVEAYAHAWCHSEPEHPKSPAYMTGFNDGLTDKRKRDAAFVKASTAKTRPPVRPDQKFNFGLKRRPAPDAARQGYKAPSEAQP
jgi:hypothetical protein